MGAHQSSSGGHASPVLRRRSFREETDGCIWWDNTRQRAAMKVSSYIVRTLNRKELWLDEAPCFGGRSPSWCGVEQSFAVRYMVGFVLERRAWFW